MAVHFVIPEADAERLLHAERRARRRHEEAVLRDRADDEALAAQPALSVGHLGLARRETGLPLCIGQVVAVERASPAGKPPGRRPRLLRRCVGTAAGRSSPAVVGASLPCGCARSAAATSDPATRLAPPGERMWPRRQTAPPRQPRRIRLAPLIPAGPATDCSHVFPLRATLRRWPPPPAAKSQASDGRLRRQLASPAGRCRGGRRRSGAAP